MAEMLERIYTIPVRKMRKAQRKKRVPRAIRFIREFVARHMKTSVDNVKIDESLNRKMWERGIEYLPSSIKVKAVKDETGIVYVTLAE